MEQIGYISDILQEDDKITKREEIMKVAQITINSLCDFTRSKQCRQMQRGCECSEFHSGNQN
jgi:hypothetical protein